MGALLKWFAGYSVGTFVAKLFGAVTFIYISQEIVDYALDNTFSNLGQFDFLSVLVLGGVTKAIGIVAGAVTLRIASQGFAGIATRAAS